MIVELVPTNFSSLLIGLRRNKKEKVNKVVEEEVTLLEEEVDFMEEETTQETKGKLAAIKGLRMIAAANVPLEKGDLIKEVDLVEGEQVFSQEGVTIAIKWVTNLLGVQRSKD